MANERTLVHVNDVDLNVVTVGRGAPTLVFLHYWGGSSRTWAPVMAHLASSGVGHIAPLEAPSKLADAIRAAATGHAAG